MSTKIKGIFGETVAALYLILKGFQILERRFKTSLGEIDIIAQKGNLVVFVEVKARKSIEKCYEAIQKRQLLRIQRASQIFLKHRRQLSSCQIRYDVVFVSDWCLPIHLQNVTM